MPNKKIEQKKGIDSVALKRILKIYILPLSSMSIFVLIVIFLIVPKVGDIFGLLDKISTQDASYSKSKAALEELQSASQKSNQMLAQLDIVNQTTPTGKTEVVKFRDKLTQLTEKNGLRILSQRLSENNVGSATDTTVDPAATAPADKLTLQEVPFTFEIEGTYNSLISFIKDMSAIEDFIIVKQMNLNSNATDGSAADSWLLKLTINKYQFSQITEEAQNNLFINVPISAEPSQNVLDYVNGRLQ